MSLISLIQQSIEQQDKEQFTKLISKMSIEEYMQISPQMDLWLKKRSKVYTYLITFTLRRDSKVDISKVEDYIRSQQSRKSLEIIESVWRREYHKDGTPHWHMAVKSRRSILQRFFNSYKKSYGNVKVDSTRDKTLTSSEAFASIVTYVTKTDNDSKN